MDTFLLLTFLLILGILLWALLGKGGGQERRRRDEDSPESLYRRRESDKEIEEEFPEDKEHPRRRKSDVKPDEKPDEVESDFELPYLADDIITDRSRFKVFKRTVLNSEIYARKGDFKTAISLYKGVNKRINDKNVNEKIEANINYLKEYQQKLTEKKKEVPEKKGAGFQGSEIKFTLDGPLKIPEKIQVDLATLFKGPSEPKIDLEKMADQIMGKLVDKKLLAPDSKQIAEKFQAEVEGYQEKVEDYEKEISRLKDKVNRIVKGGETGEHAEYTAGPQTEEREAALRRAFEGELKELETKYREELARMKDEIAQLTSGQSVDLAAQEKIDKYESEIDRLQGSIGQLMDFKEKTEEAKQKEARALDESDLGTIKDVIKNLNEKIEQLTDNERKTAEELREVKTYNRALAEGIIQGKGVSKETGAPAEADREPALAEARFQAPAGAPSVAKPGTEDKKIPSKDISRKAPVTEAPKSKPVSIPGKRKAEEEEKPDFELLSDYGKEEEDEFPDESDELSDADIFEKILQSDDQKKEEESFEILGYRKEEKEPAFEIEDIEIEKKRVEEERFYRKFLKHDKRKKKELPILKVSYDFSKLPDDFSLSKDKNILEYSFYKYKPLLEKANALIKTRNVRDAINYYKVVLSQNIPIEFRAMLQKNIDELTEYIEKYLATD